jgi:hypothetical protein
MKTTTVLGLGVLGFVLLALITIVLAGSWIEDDLAERSEERLEAAGIAGIDVDISGRDVILSSTDADGDAGTVEQAIKVVQEVWGVREARQKTN